MFRPGSGPVRFALPTVALAETGMIPYAVFLQRAVLGGEDSLQIEVHTLADQEADDFLLTGAARWGLPDRIFSIQREQVFWGPTSIKIRTPSW